MTVETYYRAKSTGIDTPVTIHIQRVNPDDVIYWTAASEDTRDSWCNSGGVTCGKYNCRPCCPPRCKLFVNMPEHDHFYAICVKATAQDYWDTHPKVDKAYKEKRNNFYSMVGLHRMTRSIQNDIVSAFTGQMFRVGGCGGCQYKKSKKCKRFAPSLEAAGIDVVSFTSSVFGEKIKWWNKDYIGDMFAIGGIYTDDKISKFDFKKIIAEVCNHGK